MDNLAEQVVEHFPTEDKVFSKNNEILDIFFFKDLFSNSLRNPGVIVMVLEHAVAFISVFMMHVETYSNKPTAHPLQKLSVTLPQVRMKMMKRNL